jgi:hypothetical protein
MVMTVAKSPQALSAVQVPGDDQRGQLLEQPEDDARQQHARQHGASGNFAVGEEAERQDEQAHVQRNRNEVPGESTDHAEVGPGGGAGDVVADHRAADQADSDRA